MYQLVFISFLTFNTIFSCRQIFVLFPRLTEIIIGICTYALPLATSTNLHKWRHLIPVVFSKRATVTRNYSLVHLLPTLLRRFLPSICFFIHIRIQSLIEYIQCSLSFAFFSSNCVMHCISYCYI